jgi:hypothetical protein
MKTLERLNAGLKRLATRRARRIFVASTNMDLQAYREEASKGIRAAGCHAVMHEDWTATGRPTVKECLESVKSSEALVVIVAHRYGWIPNVDEGGDNSKSITRLETEEARDLGLDVFPFLADASAPAPTAPDADPRAPQLLKEFKDELSKSLCGTFKTPEELKSQVTITVKDWFARRTQRTLVVALTGMAAIIVAVLLWARSPQPAVGPPPVAIAVPKPPDVRDPENQVQHLTAIAGSMLWQIEYDRPPDDQAAFLLNGSLLFIPGRRPVGNSGLLVSDKPPVEKTPVHFEAIQGNPLKTLIHRSANQLDSDWAARWIFLQALDNAKVPPQEFHDLYLSGAESHPRGTCAEARDAERWLKMVGARGHEDLRDEIQTAIVIECQ